MVRVRKYNKKIERLCNQATMFRNNRPKIRTNLCQNLSNLRVIVAKKDSEIADEAKKGAANEAAAAENKESIADEFLKRCNDDLDEISDSPLADETDDWEKVSDGSLGATSDIEDVADVDTVISEVESKEVPVGYRSHTVKRLQRYKPVLFFKPKMYVISSNRIIVNCVNSAKVETEEQPTVNGDVLKSTSDISDTELPEPIVIDIADEDEKSDDVALEVIPCSPKKQTPEFRRDKISIQEELDSSDKAILGLEFLVEIWEELGVKLKNYFCLLCDKEFEKEAVVEHLISIPHRISYLGKHFPKFRGMIFKEESFEGDEEKEYLEKSCMNVLVDLDSTLPFIGTHEEVFSHKHLFKEEADKVFCGKDTVDLLMKEICLIIEAKNDYVNKPIELTEYTDIVVEIKDDEEVVEKEVNTESVPVEKVDEKQVSRLSSANRKVSEHHRRSHDRDVKKSDKSEEKSDRSRSSTRHDSRTSSRSNQRTVSHHSRNHHRKLSPSPSKSTTDKLISKSSPRRDSSSHRNEPSKDNFKKPSPRNCEKCHAPKRSRYSYSRHIKYCECKKTSQHSVGNETKQKEESSKENATQKSERSRNETKSSVEEKNVKSEKDDRHSSAKSARHQVRSDANKSHKSDCRSSKASKSKNDTNDKGNVNDKNEKNSEKNESKSAKKHSSSHQRLKDHDHAKDDVKKQEIKPSADQSSTNTSSSGSKAPVRASPKKSENKLPTKERSDLSRTVSSRKPRSSPLRRRSRSPIVPSRRRSKTPPAVSRRRSRSPVASRRKRSKSPLNIVRRRSPPLHSVRRRSKSPFIVGRRRSRSPIVPARRRSRSPINSTWRASNIRVRRSRSPLRLMRRGSNSRAISPRRRSRSPLQLGRKQSLSPLNKRRRRLSRDSLSPNSIRRRRSRSPYRRHLRSSSRSRQSPIDNNFMDSFKSIDDMYPEQSALPPPLQQLPPPENYAASWNVPHPVDNSYNYNYGYPPPVVNNPYPPTTYPGFPCPPAQIPNPHIPPFPNTAFPPPELPNQPIPGLSCPNPPPVGVPPVSYAQPPMPIMSVSSGYDQPPVSSNIPVNMPPLQYPIPGNSMPHMQPDRHPDEKIFQDLRSVVTKLFGLSGSNSQPGFDLPDSRNSNPKGLSLVGNEKFRERNLGPDDIPFLHSGGPGNPLSSQKYMGDKERLYIETLQQIRKELGTSMNPEEVLRVVMRNMFPEEVMKDRALDILNQKSFEERKSPNKMGKPKLPGLSSKVEFKESSHMPKQGNIFPIVKQESMMGDHFGGMNSGGNSAAAFLNSKFSGQLDNKQRKDFDFRMKNDFAQETFRHGMAGIGGEREPEKKTLAQRLASVLVKLGMMDVPGPLLSEMLHKIGAFNRSLPMQDITENEIVSLLEKYGYLQRK